MCADTLNRYGLNPAKKERSGIDSNAAAVFGMALVGAILFGPFGDLCPLEDRDDDGIHNDVDIDMDGDGLIDISFMEDGFYALRPRRHPL